uniref:Uncharacterized protein n=1 Tax=Anguilla anguilla TaxID=7936 RepID=A0A0E9Q5Q7_ANGAN
MASNGFNGMDHGIEIMKSRKREKKGRIGRNLLSDFLSTRHLSHIGLSLCHSVQNIKKCT